MNNQIVIFYGNFSEIQRLVGISDINTSKHHCCWLKLYYNVFLSNKFDDLVKEHLKEDETFIKYFKKYNIEYTNDFSSKPFQGFNENLIKLYCEWSCANSFPNDSSNTDIYQSHSQYFVQQHNSCLTMKQSAIVLSGILACLIGLKEMNPSCQKKYDIIFICHDKHIGLAGEDKALDDDTKKRFEEYVKEQFVSSFYKSALDNINIKDIFSFQHEPYSITIKSFKKDWYINVEDLLTNYKNKKNIKDYIKIKDDVIKTFLPLAIDQQGLSECSEANKNLYHIELKNVNWKEIKETIELTQNSINNFEESFPEYMYFPIESKENPGFTIEELKGYLDNTNGHISISNWINKVVHILDDKLVQKK